MSRNPVKRKGLNRRDFLRRAVGGAAALAGVGAVGGTAVSSSELRRSQAAAASTSGMRYRRLGRTNLMVSELGIGCSPLGQRQARDVYLQNIGAVMRLGLERGINIFDSAPSYPGSEDAIGKALAGVPRDSYILCTKAEKTDAEGIVKGLDESLKRLKTDYVDILHEHAHYHRVEGAYDRLEFVETCRKLREQGKLRFFGVSGHNPVVLAEYLRTGQFDTVMIPYNHLTRNAEKTLFPVARDMAVGLIAIKPLTGNFRPWDKKPGQDPKLDALMREFKSDDYVSAALRFVLSSQAVASAMVGMERPEDVEGNVATVRKGVQVSDRLGRRDRRHLEIYGGLFGSAYCRMCEKCLPCPRGVAIPDIQRFMIYHDNYGHRDRARTQYAALNPSARADQCDGCGTCEGRCPHGIAIREKLTRAHAALA